jgi:hypothetical protein
MHSRSSCILPIGGPPTHSAILRWGLYTCRGTRSSHPANCGELTPGTSESRLGHNPHAPPTLHVAGAAAVAAARIPGAPCVPPPHYGHLPGCTWRRTCSPSSAPCRQAGAAPALPHLPLVARQAPHLPSFVCPSSPGKPGAWPSTLVIHRCLGSACCSWLGRVGGQNPDGSPPCGAYPSYIGNHARGGGGVPRAQEHIHQRKACCMCAAQLYPL